MKLRIEKAFTDKHTGEIYNVGDIKEFTNDRAKELLADNRNLVSAIEEAPKQEEAPAEEPKTKKSKK